MYHVSLDDSSTVYSLLQEVSEGLSFNVEGLDVRLNWGVWKVVSRSNYLTIATVSVPLVSIRLQSRWCDRVANRPGFTWTVRELAHSVQCIGKGRFCPGIFAKMPWYHSIAVKRNTEIYLVNC